jgi:hypothetical protein
LGKWYAIIEIPEELALEYLEPDELSIGDVKTVVGEIFDDGLVRGNLERFRDDCSVLDASSEPPTYGRHARDAVPERRDGDAGTRSKFLGGAHGSPTYSDEG